MTDIDKFRGYRFAINIPDREKFDPSSEAVDVTLITREGERYSANFVTTRYIPNVFEKNKRTGECVDGTWFGMKDNMVVVERIDQKSVKITIDDMIKNLEIESFFKKSD